MDLSKPTPRYASFSTVDKSKFFLWGGRELEGLNSPKALLYYFDFCNEEWNRRYLIGLLPPGFNFGSCARNGNFLYVYGGEDEDGYYTGSLFEINIETASSTKLSTTSTITPLEKNDSGMVIYKGKVILFGGKSQDPDRRTNELHSYDIPTGMEQLSVKIACIKMYKILHMYIRNNWVSEASINEFNLEPRYHPWTVIRCSSTPYCKNGNFGSNYIQRCVKLEGKCV